LKDFLRISDLSSADLELLLELSQRFIDAPGHRLGDLLGETVVMYLSKPSTRTRISFASAITRLGGAPITVGPAELQLGRGETIADTARVISSFAAAIVVRTFADEDVRNLADAASVPVINALTNGHHPCQALADLLTLRQHFGRLRGLRVAYVGDGNNVAHSLMEACAIAGVDVAVATPPGYEPDAAIVMAAAQRALRSGSSLVVTNDPAVAAAGADAIYTDVWLSMGDPEEQRAQRLHDLAGYQVDDELFSVADREAIFLHCLPAHRGEEVAEHVIDGPRSLVFGQAANRLPTAQAVLHALIAGRLEGAGALVPSTHDLPLPV
jgi:ornithine carbamoyltransferase